VLKVGLEEPPETQLRLERMARILPDEISQDPAAAAQAFVACERDRMSKHRQLTRALVTLGERNAQLEATEAALREAATMVHELQRPPLLARVWRWPIRP
jgi:acyl-CoA synthetase (NDP forming)